MASSSDFRIGSRDGAGESFASSGSVARWRQCLMSFTSRGPEDGTSMVEAGQRGGDALTNPSAAGCGIGVEDEAEADDPSEGPRFHVSVDSFRSGRPCVFFMTVRRGDAVWQIKRRFRQVWAVHTSLQQGLGRCAIELPRPPPRATFFSAAFGQTSRAFLQQRAVQIDRYLQALLKMIPCVDQCEALYKFLCYTNLRSWDYGSIIGGGAPPVAATAVAGLPRKALANKPIDSGKPAKGGTAVEQFCVVCQESMDPEMEDIRVLPCGHEFHFKCISQWLNQRNTCCVCNGAAVLTAPRFVSAE